MMTTFFLLVLSSPLWSRVGVVQAQSTAVNTTSNIVPIDCSSNLQQWTALTELVLEGRDDFLNLFERKLLKGEFMNIYNDLTTSNCDQYHRKLLHVDWIDMVNSKGERLNIEDMLAGSNNSAAQPLNTNESLVLEEWFHQSVDEEDLTLKDHNNRHRRFLRRDLQARPSASTTAPSDGSTVDPAEALVRAGMTLTYETTGSCRDCPVTRTGAFELYDDSFRRKLGGPSFGIQIRTRLLSMRSLQFTDATEVDDKADCICVEGVAPQPQAPGVQECVDLMNERIPAVQQGTGALYDLKMVDLIQLDDLSDVEDYNYQNDTIFVEEEEDVDEEEDEDEDGRVDGDALSSLAFNLYDESFSRQAEPNGTTEEKEPITTEEQDSGTNASSSSSAASTTSDTTVSSDSSSSGEGAAAAAAAAAASTSGAISRLFRRNSVVLLTMSMAATILAMGI